MSTSNSVANGARLDDCHSTVFALADLSGIKWQKFSSNSLTLSDDPVLTAFTKCLSLDILAVWRRSPKKDVQSLPTNHDSFEKELWIFWWGDEPHVDQICQQGLKDEDKGCWDEGLSYECRRLLFKAIHNLVERCLLHENFVRLGQCFVKPFSSDADEDISDRFSFSFSFFLHGESSVCTTVEITRHKNVERLTHHYIQQVNENNASNSVILSPYGLEGKLTGVIYRPHELTVKKLLEEWNPFYPLGNIDDAAMDEMMVDEDAHEPVPPVVEVIVGGIHMNYPSHFVLVPSSGPSNHAPSDVKPPTPAAATPSVLVNASSYGPASVSSMTETAPQQSMSPSLSQTITRTHRRPSKTATSTATCFAEKTKHSANDSNSPDPVKEMTKSIRAPLLCQPGYFTGRVRADSKRATDPGLAVFPVPATMPSVETSSLTPQSVQSSVTQDPMRPNPTSPGINPPDDTNLPSNGIKSPVKWSFSDSFKVARSIATSDTIGLGDMQKSSYLHSYNPFHHRCMDEGLTGSEPSVFGAGASVASTITSTYDCDGMMPPHSFLALQPVAHTIPQHQAFQQANPNIGLSNGLSGDDKIPAPFIPLGSVSDGWEGKELSKPSMANLPASTAEESSLEIKRMIEDWKDYKLPHAQRSSKRPSVQFDGHDRPLFRPSLSSQHSARQHPYSCPSSKRTKLRGKSVLVSPLAGPASSDEHESAKIDSSYSFVVDSDAQHSSLGPVKSELGVTSDPYAFNDIEDSAGHTSTFSDINLKKWPQSGWSTVGQPPWPSQSVVETDVKNVKMEPPNRSQLETLLIQNSTTRVLGGTPPQSGCPNPAVFPSSRNFVSSNKPMGNKSDMDFSMDDLKSPMLEEDEEEGAPTPPQEADDVVALPVASATTSYATQDLQRMFPTPPSMEPAFSPEGRYVPNHLLTNGSTFDQAAVNGTEHGFYKRNLDMDRLDSATHMPHGDVTQRVISSAPQDDKSGSRMRRHPMPSNYRTISRLGQIAVVDKPYKPSWEIPSNVPPANFIFPQEVPGSFIPPTTPSTVAGGLTPGTPSLSSIRTPASGQPYSVPTPSHGQGGIRSIESPRSYPTPGSHRAPKRLYVDQHGSGALFLNLLLSDSIMNLFWDKSFDQCALCVCNTNINGADVELGYLPALSGQEAQYPCSCGFSAVRNRIASVGAGLFLEDELDVVGARHENEIIHARKLDSSASSLEDDILLLAMDTCLSPFTTSDLIQDSTVPNPSVYVENVVARRDECEAFAQALSRGLSTFDHPVKVDAESLLSSIHPWRTSQCDALNGASTFDLYRLLVSLKPVLQDAIQKKRTTRSFETTQHVKGPLTWREFCKEAGKNAEPQPIPSFVVGYDQDWLAIAPSALKYWEKLLLEPYSPARDIVYAVLCPDTDQVLTSAKLFFKELSSFFESYHLGRLKPYTKAFKDSGIIRVGEDGISSHPPEGCSWLVDYQSNSEADKLQMYAQACVVSLGQMLKEEQNLDLTSLHIRDGRPRPQYVPPTPPSVQSILPNQSRNTIMPSPQPAKLKDPRSSYPAPYDPITASSIIVYILDPFEGSMSHGLWQCFLSLQKSLPKPIKDHLILQIVPVERVLQATSSNGCDSFSHVLRSLSFSAFSQCRKTMPQEGSVRSMTGFGPKVSKQKAPSNSPHSHESSLYMPPYVLSLPHERSNEIVNRATESNTLYVSYCLSHNQKYVLVTATDQRGELLECGCINIAVPPRRLLVRRKHRVSVRGEAITKLWKFCISTSSRFSAKPWRVVVGKLGRLSHGEIRDWAKYLNRKRLLSSGCRDTCAQCKLQSGGDSANIISACLTSLESDASLRIMPDVVLTNNFGRSSMSVSQSSQLKTPNDISCTHIYVFPTSAVTQLPGSNHAATEEDPYQTDTSILPADVLSGLVDEDIFTDFPSLMDPTSPAANHNHFSIGDEDAFNKPHNPNERLLSSDGTSEDASLLQQPLALGYLVSTAPPGPLPSWFWSTCPQARSRCPVFLRSALHIRTSISEEASTPNQHPLDSNKTAVVLRFVLENYNALSWLTRDPVGRDRRSCLPIHCLSLMHLYHAIEKLS